MYSQPLIDSGTQEVDQEQELVPTLPVTDYASLDTVQQPTVNDLSSSHYYSLAHNNEEKQPEESIHTHHSYDLLNDKSINSELDEEVKKYLTERRKRKAKFSMSCTCCKNPKFACCPRLPMADLVNENVFFRFLTWVVFARLYFEAIYITKIWMVFTDDNLDAIVKTCDSKEKLASGAVILEYVLYNDISKSNSHLELYLSLQ